MEKGAEPHSHLPYGEAGSGNYGDKAKINTCLNTESAACVIDEIRTIPYIPSPGNAFTICEYGAADGGPSSELLGLAIREIKRLHGDDTAVVLIYEDQPSNDFKSLFYRLHGLLPGTSNVLEEYQGLFVYASGTGFYQQCCQPESVHFGYAAIAAHWLSKRPCTLTGAIESQLARHEPEVQAFAHQASHDWERFLELRAKELVPGGRCVFINLARDDARGIFSGHTEHGKYCMFSTMTDIWKGMVEEGLITEVEFQDTTFNDYYRSEEELCAPLCDVTSGAYRLGLRLVSCEVTIFRHPMHVAWLLRDDQDDPAARQAYAESFVSGIRVWSNSAFLSGLSSNRPEAERLNLVGTLYQRYKQRVAQCPADYSHDLVIGITCIRKEESDK